MKAIGLTTYGGPEVLQVVDLPDPRPGRGEVRVQVRAAAIAPVDALMRTGGLAAAHEGVEPTFVPGMEIAGLLEEIGPDAGLEPDLGVGSPVVAFVDFAGAHGGYSEVVVLPAASVTRAPRGASWLEASSFVNNSLTARNALDALALEPGFTGAIRDGGQVASFRAYDGDPGSGIRCHVLNVRDRATDHAAIARLRELVEEGVLSMRVGRDFPAVEAVEAHRQMDAGGTRGRIVLEFPVEVAAK